MTRPSANPSYLSEMKLLQMKPWIKTSTAFHSTELHTMPPPPFPPSRPIHTKH